MTLSGCSPNEGNVEEYHENGVPKVKVIEKEGDSTYIEIRFDSTGTMIDSFLVENGEIEGERHILFPEKGVRRVCRYEKGRKKRCEDRKDRRLVKKVTFYENGAVWKAKEYFEDGSVRSFRIFNRRTEEQHFVATYNEDNTIEGLEGDPLKGLVLNANNGDTLFLGDTLSVTAAFHSPPYLENVYMVSKDSSTYKHEKIDPTWRMVGERDSMTYEKAMTDTGMFFRALFFGKRGLISQMEDTVLFPPSIRTYPLKIRVKKK